ncbi:MAG TPA: hypothetical protein VKI65_13225 [Gemmataceae bacterium]|nr:hypothetical protein [Gemmataceae bacterium]
MRTSRLLVALVGTILLRPAIAPAAESVSSKPIAALAAQLGSKNFDERESASRALDAIGAPALPALRQAARSDDAEISRRAELLVQRIDKRLETARLLDAKHVHLVYKDMRLAEAIADFTRKTGLQAQLGGDKSKLADRKITLDTGDVPVWQALDQLCERAGLTERVSPVAKKPEPQNVSAQEHEVRLARRQVALRLAVLDSRYSGMQAEPAQPVTLYEGKPERVPSCLAGAVRIRALPPNYKGPGQPAPLGQPGLNLEVMPHAGLQWHNIVDVRIEKAVDEHGQVLTQPAAGSPSNNGNEIAVWNMPAAPILLDSGAVMPTASTRQFPVRLKPGNKPSTALKEVHGVIAARVQTPAQPLLTVDNILQSAGRTIRGDKGGSLKVLESEVGKDGLVRMHILFDPPAETQQPFGWHAAKVRFLAVNGKLVQETDNGVGQYMSLLDTAGKPYKLASAEVLPSGVGSRQELRLTFGPTKGQPAPAKLVYTARRNVIIDVPFTLKDVALP